MFLLVMYGTMCTTYIICSCSLCVVYSCFLLLFVELKSGSELQNFLISKIRKYSRTRPGLHVKIGFMGQAVEYDYAPGPYRQVLEEIDWVGLTSLEATYPHIRLHDLKREDSLSFFMSTMASTQALAVIFINTDNNFRYISVCIWFRISCVGLQLLKQPTAPL